QEAPAPGVPVGSVECRPLLGRATAQEPLDVGAARDQWQHPAPEEPEVALELAAGADAAGDGGRVGVPEGAGIRRELAAAAAIEFGAPAAGSRADELQQLGMTERAIGGDS